MPESQESLPETIITSDARVRLIQTFRDLWAYRDLFWAFVGRDIKVRYKQTALGVIWIILQPLMTAGLFSVIFSQLGIMRDSNHLDRLLFFMAGLIPWTAFASGVQNASLSLESNAHLITKVYFPRMIVPGAFILG